MLDPRFFEHEDDHTYRNEELEHSGREEPGRRAGTQQRKKWKGGQVNAPKKKSGG